jgi:hypothetical protein
MIRILAASLAGGTIISFACFTSWMSSAIGGWRRLGKHFTTRVRAVGDVYRMQTGRVGIVNYPFSLTIALSPNGLRLAVWPRLFGHPPLLIPWSEFRDIQAQWHFVKLDGLTVGEPIIATICVRPRIVHAARKLGYLKAMGAIADETTTVPRFIDTHGRALFWLSLSAFALLGGLLFREIISAYGWHLQSG